MTRATRKRGLLGRDGLPAGSALMLEPCPAVHTAFMRFAIDIVFVDRQGYAVKIVRNLGPWRIAVAPRAHAVVEMAAGQLELRSTWRSAIACSCRPIHAPRLRRRPRVTPPRDGVGHPRLANLNVAQPFKAGAAAVGRPKGLRY